MLHTGQDGDTNPHFLGISTAAGRPRFALHQRYDSSVTTVLLVVCMSLQCSPGGTANTHAVVFIFPRAILNIKRFVESRPATQQQLLGVNRDT